MPPSPVRLTRREVVRLAGLSAATAAGSSVIGGLGHPAIASSGPEAFLADAYALRAQIASSSDLPALERIYDRSSSALQFERERAQYMARGLKTRWDGTVLEHRSTITLDALEVNGSQAHARLTEKLQSFWVPNLRPPSAGTLRLRQDNPQKFGITPTGPRGEVASTAMIPHEVWLTQAGGDWRIQKDAHDEFFLFDRSPDLAPGSWAAIIYGRPRKVSSQVAPTGKVPGLAAPSATVYSYVPADARWYAQTYAQNPYPSYCNYDLCGGDCTNFVSQCCRQGGEIDQSPWNTFSGACGTCGTTSGYAGSDTWANVQLMGDFMLTHGSRASTRNSVDALGWGDHIDYQWDSGWYDHKTIITGNPFTTSALVCCHSPNLLDYSWNVSPLCCANSYRFIWMETSYNA
jgi:hypothetical protein